MELPISKEYKFVTFLDSHSIKIGDTKEIIDSSKINNEMLAMMFARNYDDNVIIPNLMSNSSLKREEVSILSTIGCFQFDMIGVSKLKYEFTTLLNKTNLVVINVPKESMFVHLQVTKDVIGDVIDVTRYTTSNKLIMLAYSPQPISDISSEIHNRMINPHYLMNKIVLFHEDKDQYVLDDLLDTNLLNIQSETVMGDSKEKYENLSTTNYLEFGWDNYSGRYFYHVNDRGGTV